MPPIPASDRVVALGQHCLRANDCRGVVSDRRSPVRAPCV
jgi:hypothetical protein